MKNADLRILRLIELLVFQKEILYEAEFCHAIKMKPQTLSKIKKGMQYFTVTHIELMCKAYDVNANWIFATQNNVFNYAGSIEITASDRGLVPATTKINENMKNQ